MPNDTQVDDNVTVSLEIEGQYGEVISKLKTREENASDAEPFLSDLTSVLDTVVQTGGGTRSVLTESLPSTMTVRYNPEEIASLLTILQKYDFVTLEGNTWKPGPELDRRMISSGVED